MIAIKLIAIANTGIALDQDTWIKSYDPATNELEMTNKRSEALEFVNIMSAWLFWRQEVGPNRPDGKPNRPLTAFTVELSE